MHGGASKRCRGKAARGCLRVLPVSSAAADAVEHTPLIKHAAGHNSVVHDGVGKRHVLKRGGREIRADERGGGEIDAPVNDGHSRHGVSGG